MTSASFLPHLARPPDLGYPMSRFLLFTFLRSVSCTSLFTATTFDTNILHSCHGLAAESIGALWPSLSLPFSYTKPEDLDTGVRTDSGLAYSPFAVHDQIACRCLLLVVPDNTSKVFVSAKAISSVDTDLVEQKDSEPADAFPQCHWHTYDDVQQHMLGTHVLLQSSLSVADAIDAQACSILFFFNN